MGPVRPSEFCEHLVEVRIVPSRKTREDIVQAFANETRTGHIKHKIASSPPKIDDDASHQDGIKHKILLPNQLDDGIMLAQKI